jgi:hypothetical protein
MCVGWREVRIAGSKLTVAVAACLAGGAGCSGGSRDPSVFHPPVPVTLAWDQPDGRADYYHVKTGALLIRVDQPTVRLQLEPGSHRVEITACNDAGCSPATPVMLEYRDGRWTLWPIPSTAVGSGAAPLGRSPEQRSPYGDPAR